MRNYDIFVPKAHNYNFFVAKKHNYDIFVTKLMIMRSSIAFEDLLASSIAPQVMPPWTCLLWSDLVWCGVKRL